MQMAVEDGQVQANVHITPMRASRALALRYLATKFSTDTENIAVSLLPRSHAFLLIVRQTSLWGGPLQRKLPSYQQGVEGA